MSGRAGDDALDAPPAGPTIAEGMPLPRVRAGEVDGLTNEELVHRYTEATMRHDHAQLESMRHRDWSVLWPQSREVVHGSENFRAIVEHYPGGQPQLLRERVVGSEDQWAISPLGGAYRVAGAGSNWWAEWRMVYPDGRTYWSIALLELRDGK